VAALFWAGLAHAKPEPENFRRAKAHFKLGQSFYEAGEYRHAIDEYLTSYQMAPLPPLLFNIAQAYRQSGDRVHALEYYEKYLDAEPDAAPSPEARRHVLALRDALAARPPPSPEPVVAPSPLPDPEVTRQVILKQLLDEERVKREKEAEFKLAEKRHKELEQRREDALDDRRAGIGLVVAGGVISIAAAALTGVAYTTQSGGDYQVVEMIAGPVFLIIGQAILIPGTVLLPRGMRNLATLNR
jgi:tetratricopeptide (TPR) repeat protein